MKNIFKNKKIVTLVISIIFVCVFVFIPMFKVEYADYYFPYLLNISITNFSEKINPDINFSMSLGEHYFRRIDNIDGSFLNSAMVIGIRIIDANVKPIKCNLGYYSETINTDDSVYDIVITGGIRTTELNFMSGKINLGNYSVFHSKREIEIPIDAKKIFDHYTVINIGDINFRPFMNLKEYKTNIYSYSFNSSFKPYGKIFKIPDNYSEKMSLVQIAIMLLEKKMFLWMDIDKKRILSNGYWVRTYASNCKEGQENHVDTWVEPE